MAKLICSKCMEVFFQHEATRCAACGSAYHDFANSDEFLRREASRVTEERKSAGLEGLVGGLDCVIINTEPDRLRPAVNELLAFTGLECEKTFEDSQAVTCVLKTPGSASFLVRSRKTPSPFGTADAYPKARGLPHTRLETFVFDVSHIERYVEIQKNRGVTFLTDDIIRADGYSFIQTIPSTFTGVSIGFIAWHDDAKDYASAGRTQVNGSFRKPDQPHLTNIRELDHAATRVEARDRDPAIIEFMNLTNYNFDFSVYVKTFNSITNVARLSEGEFAMVFTSGIHPYVDEETAGPTEKFVHNYGKRVHHLAFRTENIEATFDSLKAAGMEFLLELVGSKEEGLKQTFSAPSLNTLLVNEYIYRYGDFDGFFTKGNVTLLTAATDKQ